MLLGLDTSAPAAPVRLGLRENAGQFALLVLITIGRNDEALAEFRAVAIAPEADVSNLAQAAWGLYMAGERGELPPAPAGYRYDATYALVPLSA